MRLRMPETNGATKIVAGFLASVVLILIGAFVGDWVANVAHEEIEVRLRSCEMADAIQGEQLNAIAMDIAEIKDTLRELAQR